MDKAIEGIRDEIVRRVRRVADPDRIILFGSAATGQMTRDSDIDLLILMPRCENTRHESVRIRRALGNLGYPMDVIVMESGRYDQEKNIVGGLAYPVSRTGTTLFASQ